MREKTYTNELLKYIKLRNQIEILTVLYNVFKNQASKNKPNLPNE